VLYEDRVERCEAQQLGDGRAGEPFDPLTPAASFDELPRGDVIGNATDARRMRVTGTVLSSAMLVGVAQGALDVASRYALERQQFGVAIGSFQAVKHLLADMYVRTELARGAAYAAAALYDDPRSGDADRAARTAKLLAGEAGIANGRAAVQVLGGMGFTWETLPHYYLKRAWVLEESFGTGDVHALALADGLSSEKLWT
jgi:alkylation response protein AidB-like acyl-CoA dehydrogenase